VHDQKPTRRKAIQLAADLALLGCGDAASFIRDMKDGAEQMLANEQCGGDGWWKGWEKIKETYRAYNQT